MIQRFFKETVPLVFGVAIGMMGAFGIAEVAANLLAEFDDPAKTVTAQAQLLGQQAETINQLRVTQSKLLAVIQDAQRQIDECEVEEAEAERWPSSTQAPARKVTRSS